MLQWHWMRRRRGVYLINHVLRKHSDGAKTKIARAQNRHYMKDIRCLQEVSNLPLTGRTMMTTIGFFFRTGQNEYVDNVNRTPNSPYRDSNLRQFVDNDEHNFIDNVNSRTHFPSLGPFGHVLSLTPPTHLYNKETSDHPAVVPQTTRTRSPTGIMRNPSEVAIRNFGAKNTRSKSYNFSDNGALMNGSSSSSAAEIFGSAFETNLIDSESTESQSNGTKPSKNWAQELKALFDQDDSSSVASSYMTPFSSSMIPVICCTAQYKNNYVIDPATSAALLKDETFSYGDIE